MDERQCGLHSTESNLPCLSWLVLHVLRMRLAGTSTRNPEQLMGKSVISVTLQLGAHEAGRLDKMSLQYVATVVDATARDQK